jgi:hypothetical protein
MLHRPERRELLNCPIVGVAVTTSDGERFSGAPGLGSPR